MISKEQAREIIQHRLEQLGYPKQHVDAIATDTGEVIVWVSGMLAHSLGLANRDWLREGARANGFKVFFIIT